MMHPGRLRGQQRKKLRWLKVNARRQAGFWCEVLQYMESKTKQYSRRTY
ncbi:hypothetical protein Tco_0700053, partial [Tanacetum coccineum]